MYRPLADKLRPDSLEDVLGQEHLLGQNAVFRKMIDNGKITNMIFYGPSGTGKTTIARIVAERTNRVLRKLNATNASIADIKAIQSEIGSFSAPEGVIIYLDEIQYFNKKQQQSLLEFMESGEIVLIASTTENPYFYVYSAVLSRSTVFEFLPLEAKQIGTVVRKAFHLKSTELETNILLTDEKIKAIATRAGGDVRKAINAVEVITSSIPIGTVIYEVTDEDIWAVSQRSSMRYDKDGDEHYDILSALQKSIRGSDPDAAIYYLARLLYAGDLLSACRRLLVIASENIGLAYPQAVAIVKACCDTAIQLGLPEAQIPLSQAAILMATAPKSNTAAQSIWSAMADVEAYGALNIPSSIRDAHYQGAAKLERGKDYIYPHDHENAWAPQQYLPDEIKNNIYYKYGKNKIETSAKRYWDNIKK